MRENKEIDSVISGSVPLTERQRQLIHYLIESEDSYATLTSHSALNRISRQTAAKDISELEKVGLVVRKRDGKFIKYRATNELLKMTKKM